MAEKLEELQLPKAQVEIESRGAIYAVPFFKDAADAELEKPSLAPEDAPGPGARHPPLATSVSSARGRHPASAAPFPTAPAVPEAGVPLSCGAKAGSPSPADEEGATGTGGKCAEAGREPSRTGRWSGRRGAQGLGAERSRRDAGVELARGAWGWPSCLCPLRVRPGPGWLGAAVPGDVSGAHVAGSEMSWPRQRRALGRVGTGRCFCHAKSPRRERRWRGAEQHPAVLQHEVAEPEHGTGSEGEASRGPGAVSASLSIFVPRLPPRSLKHPVRAQASHPNSSLRFAGEEGAAVGSALGGDPRNTAAESLEGRRDPGQPTEPDTAGAEGPSDALSPAVASAGDTEPPDEQPQPPAAPSSLPSRPREAVGRPAHTRSPGPPGHGDSGVTPPTRAASATSTDSQEPAPGTHGRGSGPAAGGAEDAELSGDVAESPRGASPLPPSQLQEDGEEQSGALWLPSPVAPGDGGTVPAVEATVVTPWHAEVPGGSDAPATGHEAVPQTPGTAHGIPAASSEEEEEEKEKEEEED